MLKVLLSSTVGIMSLITIVSTTIVICFWLYYTFSKAYKEDDK